MKTLKTFLTLLLATSLCWAECTHCKKHKKPATEQQKVEQPAPPAEEAPAKKD